VSEFSHSTMFAYVMNGYRIGLWVGLDEVVDGEVPRLGCVECNDALVIEVHTFVSEFDCQSLDFFNY